MECYSVFCKPYSNSEGETTTVYGLTNQRFRQLTMQDFKERHGVIEVLPLTDNGVENAVRVKTLKLIYKRSASRAFTVNLDKLVVCCLEHITCSVTSHINYNFTAGNLHCVFDISGKHSQLSSQEKFRYGSLFCPLRNGLGVRTSKYTSLTLYFPVVYYFHIDLYCCEV